MKIYAINLFEFLYMFSVIKPQDYHKLKKKLRLFSVKVIYFTYYWPDIQQFKKKCIRKKKKQVFYGNKIQPR